MPSFRADHHGFTLVELLVAITILGIVTTALGTALYVGIRASANDQRHLDGSNAEQFVSYFLSQDVRAACAHALSDPACPRSPNPSTTPASTCGQAAVVAIDTLSDPTAAAADTTIGYVLGAATLTRVTCAYGGTVPLSSRILARHVDQVTGSYPATGSCAGQFQVAVTIAASAAGNGTNAYSFAACAHRRAG